MKILLTGATGFLGFRTLEKLIDQPNIQSIIANGRTIKETHKVNHPKVKYILGNLNNEEFVDSLVKDVTHIVHAAALSSPWGKYNDFVEANIKSQQNLIQAAKKYNVNRYIYISSPSVYFNYTDKFNIKENDPLPKKFVNAYAETKRKAEIELEKSEIPYIILRPRALIGRGDTVIMPRLIKAFDEGKLKIIGKGDNIVDLTSVANVANAIILSLNSKSIALNNTFNISNGKPIKLWDAIRETLVKLGKKLPEKKVNYSIVKLVATILEFNAKLRGKKEPSLTKYGVGTIAKSITMDISKAKSLLSYEPEVSTEEAINEFVKWYKENEKS